MINPKIEIVIGGQKMIQLQHVSFKDWNPIGKPHKKPKGKCGNLSEGVKYGTSNDENLSKKTTSERTDPFGVAATLELTHSYVNDNNYTPKYSADKESNFLNQQN